MSSDYRPKLNVTVEMDAHYITIIQQLIGDLIWATYIARVDILHEVLVLSAFKASPREGHLHQVFHIFAFMKKNPALTKYFDSRLSNIYHTSFSGSLQEEFRKQYQDAME